MMDDAPFTARRYTPRDDAPPTDRLNEAFRSHGAMGRPADGEPSLVWFGDRPPAPAQMLVRDLIPRGQIAIVAGVYSAGKTFVAADLAACIMLGTPFAGREIVRPGGVLWLAAEGASEIDGRIKAAIEARSPGDACAAPFARQAFDVPRLTSPSAEADVVALAKAFTAGLARRFAGTELVMIVVDTLGSAANFVDGNSPAEAQRVMDALRRVNVATGALILLVDHFGKAVETGVMGASSKAQSADAVLAILANKTVEGDVSNRRMAVAKLRGGAGGAVTALKLRPVPLGDTGGTTCVVDWADRALVVEAVASMPARSGWSGKAQLLKAAIERACLEHGKIMRPFGATGPEVRAVHRDRVRAEFFASYAADNPDAKRKAFQREHDKALAAQLMAAREIAGMDWLWLVTGETAP